MFTIIRNNIHCRVGVSDISMTDVVLCADGRFKPAIEIPSLYAFLSHTKLVREKVAAQERNGWLAVLTRPNCGCADAPAGGEGRGVVP